MKIATTVALLSITKATAFLVTSPSSPSTASTLSTAYRTAPTAPTALHAIRGPTEKAKVLEFGWDGTTALGGAVDNSKPARMLDEIRAAGETLSDACEVFNANLEMSGDDLQFEEFLSMVDEQYEYGLIEFKNGDLVNQPGENDGSAKVLSYAALAELSEELTLKLWGEYYREVVGKPEGEDHQNIRNFMKYGWKGVDFYNGIALTKKNVGEGDWDWDSESWIP